MRNNTFIFVAILCGLLASCVKWGSRENSHLMRQAQLLVEQMPDSALALLDAVNTFDFGNAEKAEYNLLQIHAKRNAGMDISSYTEIFGVREFFLRKKDPQKAALACFYAAFVAVEQNQATMGMEYFQEAFDFANRIDDKELQGRILHNMGYLNYSSNWYDDAITLYRQALHIFQQMDHQSQWEVHTLNSIANTMMMSQTDSAQSYYQQALDLAQLHENAAMQMLVYNNMGAAYRVQGQPERSIYYGRQALQLAADDNDKVRIYLNLANVFHETSNVDSARYYIQQADTLLSNIDNIFMSASFAYFSYQIENAAGNYQKALEYHESYTKLYIEVMENNDRKLVLDMQRKYDMTIKENELNKRSSRAWRYAGVALSCLLALAAFLIYILRVNMKQKEALAKEQLALEQAEREKMEKTAELENIMQQAQTLQEMYHQRDNELKTKFLERIGIIKKVALLSPYLNENTLKDRNEAQKLMMKTGEIVNSLDLQNFIDIANELYPDFTGRLKRAYNELDDREISICCLLLFDFNNQELDLFINRRLKGTLYTIQTWKTTIRRKLNMDLRGDIKEHLLKRI